MICRAARARQCPLAGKEGAESPFLGGPRLAAALYRGSMRAPTQPGRPGLVLRVAAWLAVAGAASVIASLLTAYLIADHSSSDSSPSSLAAIGLGAAGLLLILVSLVLLLSIGLGRLFRRGGPPARRNRGIR